MSVRSGLSVAVFLLTTLPLAAQTDMTSAANGFLGVYGSFHPSDGIPDSGGRARFAPYLSAALNKLLADGAAAETRFAAKVKDSPPLVEGDLFTSMFEGATSWKLSACSASGNIASCPVTFTHAEAGHPALTWTDALLLVNTPQGWRVDDVVYGGGFQFGNTGKLTDTLRTVLREAP
ncbi:MAG: DUF3828 domain-containing protein [Rhizomicrobium sp.]